jgi:hypothetical protein
MRTTVARSALTALVPGVRPHFRVVAILVFGAWLSLGAAEATKPGLAKDVAHAVELCVQIKLPNSMARPEGFDINAHVGALQHEYRGKIRELSTADGVRRIDAFLSGEHDDLSVLCALEIAGETGRPEAAPILKRYERSAIYGVPELVKEYLALLRPKEKGSGK